MINKLKSVETYLYGCTYLDNFLIFYSIQIKYTKHFFFINFNHYSYFPKFNCAFGLKFKTSGTQPLNIIRHFKLFSYILS